MPGGFDARVIERGDAQHGLTRWRAARIVRVVGWLPITWPARGQGSASMMLGPCSVGKTVRASIPRRGRAVGIWRGSEFAAACRPQRLKVYPLPEGGSSPGGTHDFHTRRSTVNAESPPALRRWQGYDRRPSHAESAQARMRSRQRDSIEEVATDARAAVYNTSFR